ncbi:MAG: hypothetical protein K2N72_14445 [Oscillospiraceae bacterium]|nr:hypothetical protein [Oscillospiraceae bacterium]
MDILTRLRHASDTEIKEFLLDFCTGDILGFITEDLHIDIDKAMDMLYNSQTFEKLCDFETGLYRESPGYVYGIFRDEMNFGRIVQREI